VALSVGGFRSQAWSARSTLSTVQVKLMYILRLTSQTRTWEQITYHHLCRWLDCFFGVAAFLLSHQEDPEYYCQYLQKHTGEREGEKRKQKKNKKTNKKQNKQKKTTTTKKKPKQKEPHVKYVSRLAEPLQHVIQTWHSVPRGRKVWEPAYCILFTEFHVTYS